uniref:Uncharacterized protein n=1 Tax=Schistocephalus solidus TaxID=70667 RepID=A0A0X3PXB7_SCHSO
MRTNFSSNFLFLSSQPCVHACLFTFFSFPSLGFTSFPHYPFPSRSPVSTTTGRSIEVLCSSKVPALPLRSCHPYVDADFIHSYEPPLIAGPLQPIPVVASPPTRLRMPPPPPLKFGNSIPVITSRVRPGITVMPELPLEPPQPPRPSRPVVLVAKRQQSVLGDPPLRKPQEVPPTRPSRTPDLLLLCRHSTAAVIPVGSAAATS